MLPPHNPSPNPTSPAAPASEPVKLTRGEFLLTLSQWAENARQHANYSAAEAAARDVLRAAKLPAPNDLLNIRPESLPGLIDRSFAPAASLALSVMAHRDWAKIQSLDGRAQHYPLMNIKRMFEHALALDPDSFQVRKGFHSFMHAFRMNGSISREVVSQAVDSMIEELHHLLHRRFGYDNRGFNWVRPIDQQAPEEACWYLEEAASLSERRGAFMASKNWPVAQTHYSAAIHYALSSLAMRDLAQQPSEFTFIETQDLPTSTLKGIQRCCKILVAAFSELGIRSDLAAARDLSDRATASLQQQSSEGRLRYPRSELPPRPEWPSTFANDTVVPSERPVIAPTAVRAIAELAAPTPSEPAATSQRSPHAREGKAKDRPQHSANAWLSPCRIAAENEPFTIPAKVKVECTSPISDLRDKFKITRPIIEKALKDFAIEMDLLSRTQNESAALYLDHYKNFQAEYAKDPVTLIRVQVAVAYLLDAPWLATELRESASNLAVATYLTLQTLNLRGDLRTLQDIFKPIAVAARFNRLRPKPKD